MYIYVYISFLSWEFAQCGIVSSAEEKLGSKVEEVIQFVFSWKGCSSGKCLDIPDSNPALLITSCVILSKALN